MIGEYILLVVLLIAAVFIVVAVTLQKTNDEGLSGTIAGGSETYLGKDKSAKKGVKLNKWLLIACIVFAVAVLVVYIIQPDFASKPAADAWTGISEFSSIFK